MKLQDKETLNVADTVKDVLEGKKVKKEEVKYPHDMFDPKTGKKEVANNEDEHNALTKKGYTHEKPDMDEVAEPEAKGEKEFKGKHNVKKSGMKDDGTNVKEEAEEVEEADHSKEKKSKKEGNAFGKAVMAAKDKGDKEFMFAGKKYKVEDYDEDEDDKEEVDEMSDKQKKYQAFFNKALKKFGVKSPAELEGDKKKEFYDYVDANYEADNESD